MTPEMTDFLAKYAKHHGREDQLKWAAEDIIRQAMSDPKYSAINGVTPVEVDEAPAAEPASPKVTRTRKAKADSDTAEEPKAKAKAKASSKVDFTKSTATHVHVGNASTDVPSWRQAFLNIVHEAYAQGKASDIPETWFKAEKSRLTSEQSDGRFLYVNLSTDQIISRIKNLRRILGTDIVVKYEREGATNEVTF